MTRQSRENRRRIQRAVMSRAIPAQLLGVLLVVAFGCTEASMAANDLMTADELNRAQSRLDSEELVEGVPDEMSWLDAHTARYRLTTRGVSQDKVIVAETGNPVSINDGLGIRDDCSRVEALHCSPGISTAVGDRILSPDRHWAAFVREHNLWLQRLSDSREFQLTFDGIKDFGYGEMPDAVATPLSDIVHGDQSQARVMWSPDSRRIITYRADQRLVEPAAVIQYIDPGHDASRPKVFLPRRHFPGDANVATAQLIVFDVATRTRVELQIPPLTMAYEPLSVDPDDSEGWRLHTGLVKWNSHSDKVYVVSETRGFGAYTLYAIDASSGKAHAVFTEVKRDARYVQPSIYRYPPEIYSLDDDRTIMVSQRDGWAHLYSYKTSGTNQPISRLTQGEWNVGKILKIDESHGWLYFSGVGKEAGDPYLRQVYRVHLKGGVPERLTPEDADHEAHFSPDGAYFLDIFSTVNTPPTLVLRRADGKLIKKLATANIDSLLATGMVLPERFHVKARDGVTDIYGVLYRPRNFDAAKHYPIIDYDYGSQNTIHASRTFQLLPEQSFNELGYVLVTIDGMGTPMRSVAFRDIEDYRGAAGLGDHPGAIRQLATRYPFIDADRAGIYGCSGGGYGAALGILKYPEFYKVAVSAYGNNDQRLYSLQVGERYLGMPDANPEVYASQATKRLAGNLQGKLLLIQGLMDDLVNPAIVFQFAQALIDADKPFDMMIFPNDSHCDDSPYYWKVVWRYFKQNLQPED